MDEEKKNEETKENNNSKQSAQSANEKIDENQVINYRIYNIYVINILGKTNFFCRRY